MTNNASIDNRPPIDQFHTDAASVLTNFRNAILGIVRSTMAPPINGQELENALGIDKTLAWKVASMASATSPFDVARHIPGRSAINIIIRAGERTGIKLEVLERVRDAYADYEELMRQHAGDRASLEMMLITHAQNERAKATHEYRKAAYRANSFLFGIQSQATFRTYMLQPSNEHAGMFDMISLRGHIGIRRIRNDAPWTVHRSRVTDDTGSPITFQSAQPLDPSIETDIGTPPVPWMPKFCSQPLPNINRVSQRKGHIHCDILNGEVGNQAMTSCVLGEIVTGLASSSSSPGNETVELAMKADMPTELLVLDQYIHQDLVNFAQPKLNVYSELTGPTPPISNAASRHRIPMDEHPQYLGEGVASAYSPKMPQYPDLIRDAFEYSQWSADKFIVHRTIIKYPPTPSAVVHSISLLH